jgi:hypothetical protein
MADFEAPRPYYFFLAAGIAQAGHFSTMRRRLSIAVSTRCFESPVNEPFRPRISSNWSDSLPMIRRVDAANSSRVVPVKVTSTDGGLGLSGDPLPSSASSARSNSRALMSFSGFCRPVCGSVSSVSGVSVAAISSGSAAIRYRTLGSSSKKTATLRFFSLKRWTRM